MIEQLRQFISNEGSSMLPVIGDYLITSFILVYNVWFTILFKIVQLLSNAYWVKTLTAFLSFFVSIYTLLYAVKTMMRLIFFIIIKITRTIFCYIYNKLSKVLKVPTEVFQKPKNILKPFQSKDNEKPMRTIVKHSKVVSTNEIEELEKQLRKRGYPSDCFELREEAATATLPALYNQRRQIIAVFKKTGKWRTYPCGKQYAWVEDVLQDLDNKVFEPGNNL